MIRRTLRNGLVAAVAAVAVFPVTAVASAAPAQVTAIAPAALAAHAPSWATPMPISAGSWYPTLPQSALPGRSGARHTSVHHARRHATTHTWRRHLKTHAPRHVIRHTRHHLAAHTWGRVTTHHLRLNVRSGPGTGYRVIGSRSVGHVMGITCKKRGSSVQGNRRWYKLAHHKGYVSAHYVHNRNAVRWC